jgi:rod shape-determining protein MreC
MSYSSRSSFFLKVKSITQQNSSSLFKKIRGCFYIGTALLLLCLPIAHKKSQVIEAFIDDKLSGVYNKAAVINSNARRIKENFLGAFSLFDKNAQLKSENERLRIATAQLSHLTLENENLKLVNKFSFPKTKQILSTRLIFRSDGQATTAKILAGKEDGIRDGQFVVSTTGALLGKIINVSDKTAKLLLINDPKSKLSVRFPRINNKAIVSGNYNENLQITITQTPITPAHEDLVVTSGDDGHFPAGLPVGTVHVSGNNEIEIIPAVNPKNTDLVSVLELEGRTAS